MPNKIFKYLFCWGLLLASLPVFAVIETYEFENAEQETRYQHFTEVLRCPKCQNQNLEGSDSAIAADLRAELATQILAGKNDDEIVEFMVARFGDFVLYDPPFKANTWLLWLAPAGLFLAGMTALMLLLRRRKMTEEIVVESIPDAPELVVAGLSKQQTLWVLAVTLLIVLGSAIYFYHRLGAFEALAIGRMANDFYEEVEQANREQRAVDPAIARQLLLRLQENEKPRAAEITGSDLQRLYLQGSLHAYLSEFEQAIPFYKEYLMAMPADERVLTEYVQILYLAADRQLTERVQFVVARALELNPHNQEVLALLALHRQQGGE